MRAGGCEGEPGWRELCELMVQAEAGKDAEELIMSTRKPGLELQF